MHVDLRCSLLAQHSTATNVATHGRGPWPVVRDDRFYALLLAEDSITEADTRFGGLLLFELAVTFELIVLFLHSLLLELSGQHTRYLESLLLLRCQLYMHSRRWLRHVFLCLEKEATVLGYRIFRLATIRLVLKRRLRRLSVPELDSSLR